MPSNREQLEQLQAAMALEEQQAIAELHEWFASSEGTAFANTFIALRERTIPNSHFDQILTSFLASAANVESLAKQNYEAMQQSVEAQENQVSEAN